MKGGMMLLDLWFDIQVAAVNLFIRLDNVLLVIKSFWARSPLMLRSLLLWAVIVIGCNLVLTKSAIDRDGYVLVCAVISVLGFALGYLFSVIDRTEGFTKEESAECGMRSAELKPQEERTR